MISATMAVAAAGTNRPVMAEFARDARLARAIAIVIDTIVFAFISLVINNVYGVTQVTSGSPLASGMTFAAYSTETVIPWPWLAALAFLYFTITEATFGATPGKRWMGLRVVRADGQRLSVGAVIIRNLLRPLDYLPVFYLVGGFAVWSRRAASASATWPRERRLYTGTVLLHPEPPEPRVRSSAGPCSRRWLWQSFSRWLSTTSAGHPWSSKVSSTRTRWNSAT